MKFPLGDMTTLFITGFSCSSEPSSPRTSGQGTRPGNETRNIYILQLLELELTEWTIFLRKNLGFLSRSTEQPGGHLVEPDDALVITAGQHLVTALVAQVHVDLGSWSPGDLQQAFNHHGGLIRLELLGVSPADDDLGVANILHRHQLVAQAADTVNVGDLGDILESNSNQLRLEIADQRPETEHT